MRLSCLEWVPSLVLPLLMAQAGVHAAPSLTADLDVNGALGGRLLPVRPNYASLMIEWQRVRHVFSSKQRNLGDFDKKYFRDHFLKMLSLPGNALGMANSSLLIRIGGNSADDVYYTASKYPRDDKMVTPVEPYDLQLLDEAADALGLKYILCIGLRVIDIRIQLEKVEGWKRYIKRANIHSIEVGNEPDHLAKRGERPAGYSYADFLREYRALSKGIREIFPDMPLMGPSYAYEWRDEHQLQFMQDEIHTTRYISIHRYQLFGCAKGNTLDMLLDSPAKDELAWFQSLADMERPFGNEMIWGEGASASCNGVRGISDVFGAGLWTLDALFEFAWRGSTIAILSGTPQAIYAPIGFVVGTMNFTVNAPFYALMAFNMALGGPSSSVYIPKNTGTNLRLKTWAVWNADASEYTLVCIQKQDGPSASLTVSVPGAGLNAQMMVFGAPSVTSRTGFTLGGMTINATSGYISQEPAFTVVQADGATGGRFRFQVPGASAVVIRFTTNTSKPLLREIRNTRLEAISRTIVDEAAVAAQARRRNASITARSAGAFMWFNTLALASLVVVLWW